MNLQEVTLQNIENIFWESMEVGWASGNAQGEVNLLFPGFKCIPFHSGKFRVLDAYAIPLEDKSVGFTYIWFADVLVWSMSYSGSYPKAVISFLKYALKDTITSQDFIGGRGPRKFLHDTYPNLVYRNKVDGNFAQFTGQENIHYNKNGYSFIGMHKYCGMALI